MADTQQQAYEATANALKNSPSNNAWTEPP